jgi:hypothetical protein
MAKKCIIFCDVILCKFVTVKPKFRRDIILPSTLWKNKTLCSKQQAKCDIPHNGASGNTVNFYELLFLCVTGELSVSVLPLFS